jgi:hypothetical protein
VAPTFEILNGSRSPLLDVRRRTSQLDDLVEKALRKVQEKYLTASEEEQNITNPESARSPSDRSGERGSESPEPAHVFVG